ncbi:DUF433 domain-containing protein [Streptomyces acidicola]|uniref:DUF433 domain-containing protein n=1 Tax=Streptomyces acidicola TaxID=2596892 RepID=UPI0037F591F7
MIDPGFGHGRPVVAANRVAVSTITDLWEAGESIADIAYDVDMTPEQVDALCRAVVRLAPRVVEKGGPAASAVRHDRIERTWP